MKSLWPKIDFFDQDFVDLMARSFLFLDENWERFSLETQLLLHPYVNGRKAPKLHGDYTVWDGVALYSWMNRMGDVNKANEWWNTISPEMNMGRLAESGDALRSLVKWTLNCADDIKKASFSDKVSYFSAKTRIPHDLRTRMQNKLERTLVDLHAEVVSHDKVFTIFKCMGGVFPSFESMEDWEFFWAIKAFEKYGYITECRMLVIQRIYALLDSKRMDEWVLLTTIVLMIEQVIGLQISDWRRVVYWMVPSPDFLAVKNLVYRNNPLHCEIKHTGSWRVHLKSEREFLLSLHQQHVPAKVILMPIGACSFPL